MGQIAWSSLMSYVQSSRDQAGSNPVNLWFLPLFSMQNKLFLVFARQQHRHNWYNYKNKVADHNWNQCSKSWLYSLSQ